MFVPVVLSPLPRVPTGGRMALRVPRHAGRRCELGLALDRAAGWRDVAMQVNVAAQHLADQIRGGVARYAIWMRAMALRAMTFGIVRRGMTACSVLAENLWNAGSHERPSEFSCTEGTAGALLEAASWPTGMNPPQRC